MSQAFIVPPTIHPPIGSAFAAVALKRLLHSIPIFFAIISINFLLIHLAPGDPASYLAGQSEGSVEYQAQLRKEFGLDKPLIAQLGIYLGKVVTGDRVGPHTQLWGFERWAGRAEGTATRGLS